MPGLEWDMEGEPLLLTFIKNQLLKDEPDIKRYWQGGESETGCRVFKDRNYTRNWITLPLTNH